MTDKILAIDNYENLCFKCLRVKNIKKYSLYRTNYGSDFDNFYTHLQLCNECKPQNIDLWFNEESETVDYVEYYKYEKNIKEFVDSLPLQGQELFWNRCAYGANAYNMDSQDWIDEKLGLLSDEKYEEYGMYSPRQIRAYKERFSTCEHVFNVKWEDGGKSSRCPFGAYGKYNQNVDDIICSECYYCKYFKERETKIKEINGKDIEDYQIYQKVMIRKEELEKKFDNL